MQASHSRTVKGRYLTKKLPQYMIKILLLIMLNAKFSPTIKEYDLRYIFPSLDKKCIKF